MSGLSNMKHLILKISENLGSILAVDPIKELQSLKNCSSLSRFQVMSKYFLNKKNINIYIPLSFIVALIRFNWIV